MNYDKIIQDNKHHFDALLSIVKNICEKNGEIFEGNCFFEHGTFNVNPEYKPKQKNIMEIASRCVNIMEIGFNAGHSSLLMLLANPRCRIVAIDICIHNYTKPCAEYLNNNFQDRVLLLPGDSHAMLREFYAENSSYRFDAIHIDGSHDTGHTNIDFFLSKQMSQQGSYIILDDTELEGIRNLWDGYIRDGHLQEFTLVPVVKGREHTLGRYL